MDQDILTSKGTVVTRRTLLKLWKSKLVCESEKIKRDLFDDVNENKIGSSISYPENTIPESYIYYEYDSEQDSSLFSDVDNTVEYDGTAEFERLLPLI